MRIVYGYLWGVWWWRTASPNTTPNSLLASEHNLPIVSGGLRTLKAGGLAQALQAGLARRVPATIPIDVVSAGTPHYSSGPHTIIHRWNGFVPIWTICNMGPQDPDALTAQRVCSPEFCLLQVTTAIHTYVHENVEPWQQLVMLVELYCEFCGTYAKDVSPAGFHTRAHQLASVSSIAFFAGRVAHEAGTQKLWSVLYWVLDNLHSPMETATYLLLCLPPRYGGMGLARPLSNYKLDVPQILWAKTRLRSIYPDLFWPEASLMAEYDSKQHHDGHERQDQERQELAQDMGYRVITFRPDDLANASRFRAKAQSVARYLGQELPAPTAKFNELHGKLRDMLLFHERWL